MYKNFFEKPFSKSYPHPKRQIKLDLNFLYIIVVAVDLWKTNLSFLSTLLDNTMLIKMLITRS